MPAPKTIYDLIRDSNPEGMGAAAPKMMIGTSAMGSNMLGYVDSKFAPNIIVLNQALMNPKVNSGIKHTIPHEFEHILQNQVDMRGRSAPKDQQTNYDTQVLQEYGKLGGSPDKLIANLKNAAVSPALTSRLEQIVGTPVAAYLGKMNPGNYDLREQFAELSALERTINKDLTADPIVRKEFFGNDQAMVDAYKATTGYRTQRTDARDLPPMTVQPSAKSAPTSETPIIDRILDFAKKALAP